MVKKRNALSKSVLSVMLALLICLGYLFIPKCTNAEALTYSLDNSLHVQTKIYSKNFSDDYYDGCEDYANYTSSEPSITVFTPGLDSAASVFSNDGGKSLAYNQSSIIAAICRDLDNNVDIYYALCTEPSDWKAFQLYKLDIYDYSTDGKETARIGDISKHIILLFESSIKDHSNQDVYEQFDYVMDSISMQYKELAGVLPRLNLVGHSRGGLTNIQFATEHPYNVASVFSMGTPYSGSTLGQIDFIMKEIFGYIGDDGEYANMGAKDIMTPEVALQLRDNWNSVYNNYLDSNINVVAFGSMASMSMVEAFAHDLPNYGYKDYVEDYMGLIDFVIQCATDYPISVPVTLIIINGLAAIFDCFGVDLLPIVGDLFDKEVLKSITNEELREISSLVNFINGEVVIMDDLFIDTDSQLGYGFDDEKCYDGFKRYIKIFTSNDATTTRSVVNQPCSIHNIETMNWTFVDMISKSLVYGVAENEIQTLSDMTESTIEAKRGTALYFAPESTGDRKLAINNVNMSLYEYTDNNCLNPVEEFENVRNELNYNFKGSHRYLIVVDCDNNLTRSYNFSIESKLLSNKNNSVTIEGGDSNVYLLEATESGYYNMNIQSPFITVVQGDRYAADISKFEYLQAGDKYLIILGNSSDKAVNTSVELTEPIKVDLEAIGKISSDKQVVNFTNPYSANVRFKLTIDTSGDGRSAAVYNCDNNSIGTVVTGVDTKTIYFTLGAQEKCFIVFSHTDNSINAQIGVDEQQLRWKINNILCTSDIVELRRGESYDIQLVLYANGQYLDQFDTYVTTSHDEYFTFSYGKLTITDNAALGYDIVIIPVSAPENILTIRVGKGREEIDYIVTFDKQGGAVGTSSVVAHYNKLLPSAIAPERTGHKFLGYYAEPNGKGTQYYDDLMQCVHIWDKEEAATLYAYWELGKYTLTVYWRYNSDIHTDYTVTYGQALPEFNFAPVRDGYTFVGYFTLPNGAGEQYYKGGIIVNNEQAAFVNGMDYYYVEGTECCYPGGVWNVDYNLSLYAYWEPMKCKYTLRLSIYGGESKDGKSYNIEHGKTIQITAPDWDGYTFQYFTDGEKKYSDSPCKWTPSLTLSTGTGTIRPVNSLVAVYEKSCVAEGTLVTLADGRQVPVETLTGNEQLLVWNLLTGKFDSAKILFIDSDPAKVYKVINLHFSDGTTVKVISEHAFWDFDLNKYVYLDSNAAEYIGHWFNKQIVDDNGQMTWTKVQLVNVEIREEYTTSWSPVTYGHLCYFVNGMLSMPGGIEGLFNIFEVNAETMKYDEAAMQTDIEKYGLFTYEEFAEILPVPIEMFEAVNGQYLKVAIGKGLIDFETLERLVLRYAQYFVNE